MSAGPRFRTAIAGTAVAVIAFGPPTRMEAAGPGDDREPVVDAAQSDIDEQPDEIVHSWSLRPAGSLDPSEAGNRSSFSYAADPGSVIEDAVTLANHGTVQLTFRVYATDAFNNVDGAFDLLAGSEIPIDVGAWVSLPQEHVTVAPGREVTIPIVIDVPADATPGDHVGAVLASNAAVGPARDGRSVTFDRRTGPRLYLRVNGPLRPELAVERVDTAYEAALNPLGGTALVTYRVQNRGNVALGGTHRASISGPFGLGKLQSPAVALPELLPGQGVTLAADFEGVPALFVAVGDVEVEPAITDAGLGLPAATRGASAFAPPVSVLLGLVALAFTLVAVRRYRSHRRSGAIGEPGEADDNEAVAPADREPQPI